MIQWKVAWSCQTTIVQQFVEKKTAGRRVSGKINAVLQDLQSRVEMEKREEMNAQSQAVVYSEGKAPYFGPLTTPLTFLNKLVFRPRPGDPGVPS